MTRSTHTWELTRTEVETFIYLDEVDSTNLYCASPDNKVSPFTLVLTENQTRGRGRRNREWVSRAGESVAVSLVLPLPSEPIAPRTWLPLVAGAALVHSLRKNGLPDAALKWPNDVLIDTGKLAGILCEAITDDLVVVGLGINRDFSVDKPPDPHATALFHHLPDDPTLLDRILSDVVRNLKSWLSAAGSLRVLRAREQVDPVMATLGRVVKLQGLSGETWTGRAVAIGDAGELLVEPSGGGRVRPVVSSDIEHLSQ